MKLHNEISFVLQILIFFVNFELNTNFQKHENKI